MTDGNPPGDPRGAFVARWSGSPRSGGRSSRASRYPSRQYKIVCSRNHSRPPVVNVLLFLPSRAGRCIGLNRRGDGSGNTSSVAWPRSRQAQSRGWTTTSNQEILLTDVSTHSQPAPWLEVLLAEHEALRPVNPADRARLRSADGGTRGHRRAQLHRVPRRSLGAVPLRRWRPQRELQRRRAAGARAAGRAAPPRLSVHRLGRRLRRRVADGLAASRAAPIRRRRASSSSSRAATGRPTTSSLSRCCVCGATSAT